MDYTGTLLLVSHDRTFLDNVVTSTIAFEGNGEVHEYIGGYEDWLRQKRDTSKKAEKIDGLEVKIEELTNEMGKPEFYQQEQSVVASVGNQLKELQEQLDNCFARWEELEG